MHKTTIYNLKIDLANSHGAYLHQVDSQDEILDLFGMYSSLPLGYGHPVFQTDEFKQEVLAHAGVKLPNCEMRSEAAERFYDAFRTYPSMQRFSHFHFCCTGAAAVEAAIKTAMIATQRQQIVTFTQSFHGIYGMPGLFASSAGPAGHRTRGLPQLVLDGPVAACVVEPIQCTAGDRVFTRNDLRRLRDVCTETGVALIFDEVQTGFGGTGTMWYFEQTGVVPDIVVFGKKSQVSGIMVTEKFSEVFERRPEVLEATWDGDVIDMIRCRAILEAYDRLDILGNVARAGKQLSSGLPDFQRIGLLFSRDFGTRAERDVFVRRCWDRQVIMIPTGEKSVRLRPHLAITEAECDDVIQRLAA